MTKLWSVTSVAGQKSMAWRQGWLCIVALSITTVLCAGAWLLFRDAAAQSLPPTRVQPNIGHFPLVTVNEPCPAEVTGAAADQWLVTEDQVPQKVIGVNRRSLRPQTQTAIFIDLFDHKEAVIAPIGDGLEVLYDLYVSNTFTIPLDELAVFLPGASAATLDKVVDWTGNAGVVVNNVRAISTARAFAGRPHTPLIALLQTTIRQLPPSSGTMRQRLVVFSDGTDIESSPDALKALIEEAKQHQVAIDAVFIDTGYRDYKTLKALEATSGRFLLLPKEEAQWVAFWRPLVSAYDLCEITYRSTQRQPLTLTIQALVSDTLYFSQSYSFPTIKLPPPAVTITAPAGEQIVLSPTAKLTQPQALNLVVEWDFPIYSLRNVKQIIYDIKGPTNVPRTELLAPLPGKRTLIIPLPLAGLAPGGYSIQVEVIDELGLKGGDRAPFALLLPPSPTPTATPSPAVTPPTATPTVTPTATPLWYKKPVIWSRGDYPYRMLLLLMGPLLVLLGYGLYTLWRQRGEGEIVLNPDHVTGARVNAILYRIDAEPDQPLKQVVKLSDKSNDPFPIPTGLYTYRGEVKGAAESNKEPLSLFRAQIELHDSRYRLRLTKESKPVKYKRRREEKTVESELFLEPNDTLIFGSTQYIFYFLPKDQPPPDNAPNPAAREQG